MGQFTIKSKRDIDDAALESSVAIADNDINRITVAYAKLYFPNGVEVPGTPEVPAVPATYDEEGNVLTQEVPAVPATPSTYRAPTGTEVFNAIATGLLQGILNNTVSQEKVEAAKSAQETVTPIVIE